MNCLNRSNSVTRQTRRRPRRGAVTVETALVLPLVLLFLMGILEYGRYVMMLQLITNAAREGARYAMTHSDPVVINGTTYGNATADVTNIINKFMAGHTLAGQNVQVFAADSLGNNIGPWSSAEAGDSVCVQVTGNFTCLVPKLLYMPNTIPMNIRVVMRSEAN
jgi:Flp pilus assembly protein TadG